jgi:hypothetical protein
MDRSQYEALAMTALEVFEKQRELRDAEPITGGMADNGDWANVYVMFLTYDDAKAAEKELRDAGYKPELLADEFDDYSTTTFMTVSGRIGTADVEDVFDRIGDLVAALNGEASEYWQA